MITRKKTKSKKINGEKTARQIRLFFSSPKRKKKE